MSLDEKNGMEIETEKMLQQLLFAGQQGDFASIAGMCGLPDWVLDERPHSTKISGQFGDELNRLYSILNPGHAKEVAAFGRHLSEADYVAFVKAIAVYEQCCGTFGSGTLLQHLVPIRLPVSDPRRDLLDWLLRNTDSYSYYAHGTRSVEELDDDYRRRADIRERNMRADQERQARDKQRISAKATKDLPNAVRRGDKRAVRALIKKSADLSATGANGVSLATKA